MNFVLPFSMLMREWFPLQQIDILKNILTLGDLLFACFWAFWVTLIVKFVAKLYRHIKNPQAEFGYGTKSMEQMIEKCKILFPNQIVRFKGNVFTRGMSVKITTISARTFEGELIGLNSENIICVINPKHIAADLLDNVAEIIKIEDV